jgi:hypothetical protein
MLTVYTSTFCRPDLVQLLASALNAVAPRPYEFVVVVQRGGLRREWQHVSRVVQDDHAGTQAWIQACRLAGDGSTNLYLHDDCIPLRTWTLPGTPCARSIGPAGMGSTLIGWQGRFAMFRGTIPAPRACADTVPGWWPDDIIAGALEGQCEVLLAGDFLHLDKSTLVHPDAPVNRGKWELVESMCSFLGIEVPRPLTAEELAFHPGWRPSGLGDMVAATLASVGITAERVSAALGVNDCGCKQRQEQLNALGRRLGIG